MKRILPLQNPNTSQRYHFKYIVEPRFFDATVIKLFASETRESSEILLIFFLLRIKSAFMWCSDRSVGIDGKHIGFSKRTKYR